MLKIILKEHIIKNSSLALLLTLLICQFLLMMFHIHSKNLKTLSGDEFYYLDRATYIYEHKSLPNASQEHFDLTSGKLFGRYNDYRPVGLPLYLYTLGVTKFNHPEKRGIYSVINFIFISFSILIIYWELIANMSLSWLKILTSFILGIQPWMYEFCTSFYPDSIIAYLVFPGIYLWSKSFYKNSHAIVYSVAGSLTLGLSILFRYDMIPVIAILPFIAFFILRCYKNNDISITTPFIVYSIVFLLFLIFTCGHRYWFEERFFPKVIHATPGLEKWTSTWLGTEHERYNNLVFSFTSGRKRFEDIPGKAFSSDFERQIIFDAMQKMNNGNGYTRDIDNSFMLIAKHRQNNFFSAFFLPRLWFTLNLGLNMETNSYLLNSLSYMSSSPRKVILSLLMIIKIVSLGSLLIYVIYLIKYKFRDTDYLDFFSAMALLIVLFRYILFGFPIAMNQHRYVVLCWPFIFFIFAYLILKMENKYLTSHI